MSLLLLFIFWEWALLGSGRAFSHHHEPLTVILISGGSNRHGLISHRLADAADALRAEFLRREGLHSSHSK